MTRLRANKLRYEVYSHDGIFTVCCVLAEHCLSRYTYQTVQAAMLATPATAMVYYFDDQAPAYD